ncbi:cation transporting ATPase C-terminal domain-containing protein [Nonomuraea sp. NPDC000554]|uniref:cation transporting ATPase C-terminal domain-containing protein n=1 Tax=Nonomuraea sp. NPDC000554 TaxID=3154259 RepID=UPI0033279077
MLAAGLLLPFLPMLPAQVLLQNLCFDAAQLALAFDAPAPDTLRRPLRLRPRRILRFVVAFGLLNAVADLTTFAMLTWVVPEAAGAGGEEAFHTGWFVENLLTQALIMLLLRPGRRPAVPLRVAAGALADRGTNLDLSPA